MVERNLTGTIRPQGVDAETANRAARQIALALLHGNAEEAHAIIDGAFSVRKRRAGKSELLELGVNDIGLEIRIVNKLETLGIFSVRQLLNTPREVLLSCPNFGTGSLVKVLAAVQDLGFCLEEDMP